MDRNILTYNQHVDGPIVALLAEGVDRNLWLPSAVFATSVALLAEGVDRNCMELDEKNCDVIVALLAEGVDRN